MSDSNSYNDLLKRAHAAQAQDLEEEISLNTVAKNASASQVQQRTEKDERKIDRRVRDSTLQESSMSKTQQEQHKSMMEAERIQRQVMMQEISSIHCSNIRDKNTY
jgi:hypothetical protein